MVARRLRMPVHLSAREAALQINAAFDERLVDRVCVLPYLDSPQRVVLDMDSTEIPVYGQQEK